MIYSGACLNLSKQPSPSSQTLPASCPLSPGAPRITSSADTQKTDTSQQKITLIVSRTPKPCYLLAWLVMKKIKAGSLGVQESKGALASEFLTAMVPSLARAREYIPSLPEH